MRWSRKRLIKALGALSDGILPIDSDNRVELFNHRYVEIFSQACGGKAMSDEIVHGRNFFDMIRSGYELALFKPHPGGVDAWLEQRRATFETMGCQLEMPLGNGTWLLRNERPIPDGGRIAIYTDITEFKRRESETNQAGRSFEDALESIACGFALWDQEDRRVVSNSKYREYFSHLADMAVPAALFAHLASAAVERGQLPQAIGREKEFVDQILTVRRQANGVPREQFINGVWLQITQHPTGDGGIVSIYTDFIELKKRQEEVEHQSAILELTMENLGQGITRVDRDLKTIALNQKVLELMELPADLFERGLTMEQTFRYSAERGEYGPGD